MYLTLNFVSHFWGALQSLPSFPSVSSLALPCFFRPSLHGRYPASPLLRRLLTSPPLSRRRSPQVRYRIFPLVPPGSTRCVSDDFWASLLPASLPPASSLTASSCSYGREFATRFFRLRLAATLCVSLRLSSSTPSSSFHLDRFCPCWAHCGQDFILQADFQSASHGAHYVARGPIGNRPA